MRARATVWQHIKGQRCRSRHDLGMTIDGPVVVRCALVTGHSGRHLCPCCADSWPDPQEQR